MNTSRYIRVFVLGTALATTFYTGFFDADLYERGELQYRNRAYLYHASHEHTHNDYDTTCLVENNMAVVSSSSTISASGINMSGAWSACG